VFRVDAQVAGGGAAGTVALGSDSIRSAPEMDPSMTAMIRLPERWQVASALSCEKAVPGDVRQRTDESVAIRTHERNDGRGELSDRLLAATHSSPSPVAHDASRGDEHQSAGVVRQAIESFVAISHSTSGFDIEWLTVRASTDSMVDKRPVLRVAHNMSMAVELQTSKPGVNELKY